MSTATETIRTMGVAPADRGRWNPPTYWTASDGCTGVRDLVFGHACRRHDWRWRYFMWPFAELLSHYGVVGLLALAVVSVLVMIATNIAYLFEQYVDLWGSRRWWHPHLWLFPLWRFGVVMVTGLVWFNCMGDGR